MRTAPTLNIVAKETPKDQPIGMLAATHAGFRAVFEDLGLDYYCAGNLTLDDAAEGAGLDPDDVRLAMQRVIEKDPGPNWVDQPLRELTERLEREHHQLLRSSVFQTAVLLDDALSLHGESCAGALRHNFRLFSEQLLQHIELEEVSLFPAAASIDDAWIRGDPIIANQHEIRRLIGELTLEHGRVIEKLNILLAELPAFESIPDDVCRKIIKNIRAIERHIHAYLNLENSIVFPRVLALLDEQLPKPITTFQPGVERWGIS
jgi:iron-sulfur cluster repair protein YtfE (RIC family)